MFGNARRWKALTALTLSSAALVTLAPSAGADVVTVELNARRALVKVAPGVKMWAWTFNGQVPGPVIRVSEGDTVQVTLRNSDGGKHHHGGIGHSVDFHAARIAPSTAFVDVPPGEEKTFSFVASNPGVFMYHCGTSPVLEHVGMGMYGAIIVDPAEGRPPAHEVALVQSEFYGKVRDGRLHSSYEAMQHDDPRYVTFNGLVQRYVSKPIEVAVGETVRIYLVDAGPTLDSDFHVIGNIFDTVQIDGNPDNQLHGVSTQLVPSGGGAMFELTFPEAGAYPFVTHALRWADAGAVGKFIAE
jgi:nitrite reductase (NO-forming)